jgi:hypothetical protein
MRTRIGKARILKITVELDNNTTFIIDPRSRWVQTVKYGVNGFVLDFGDVSMERFLEDGERILKEMQEDL